jgi:CheY-like chemotaxis protein
VTDPKARARTALIAEDHPAYLARVAGALIGMGVRVVAVTDGAKAIELVRSGVALDLLVTDLDMPHENGWAVIDAWLADGRDIAAVVMVTGEADSREVQQRCAAGGIRLVHKVSFDAHFGGAIAAALGWLDERAAATGPPVAFAPSPAPSPNTGRGGD